MRSFIFHVGFAKVLFSGLVDVSFRIVVPVEKLRKDPDWSKWVGVQEVSVTVPRISHCTQGPSNVSGPFGWVPVDHFWVSYNFLLL
jgi:hypothetical protein